MPWNLNDQDTQTLVVIVRDLPSFGNDEDRRALLVGALGLTKRAKEAVVLNLQGARNTVATRVIEHLANFGKLENGTESLELFLINSVAPKVDLPVGEQIHEIINRCRIKSPSPEPPPLPPPDEFDPGTENVKRAIRTRLTTIQDCTLLDENENPVRILKLLADKLGCGDPAPGADLTEHLASFLTTSRADKDLMSLVRVLRLSRRQGKQQEAGRIGEIVDRLLPLRLPGTVLSEAWQQLHVHKAVLIPTSVTTKTGAQVLVAGLHHQPAKFRKGGLEPIGEQLVPYEGEPIGDPHWNVESALRDLYIATFHVEVKEGLRAIQINLTLEQMQKKLRGHYRARKDDLEMPCYCVVKLATNKTGRESQARLLAELGIPDLLFVGLAVDSETTEFESYIITCINTRFEAEGQLA
jgi:hypothetical protein